MMQMPPPQQQWTGQATGSQQRHKKRRNNGGGHSGYGGQGGSPFGMSPNLAHNQQGGYRNYGGQQRQANQGNYGQRNGNHQHGHQQGRQPGGRGNGMPFSNAIKQNMNLCYCFTCGYDVDHQGFQCPVPRNDHIPTVSRDDAHTIWGASMKAQHKTLPDGTGAGMGWILAQNLRKANFVMDKRQANYQQ
jgi:hypothetical protein